MRADRGSTAMPVLVGTLVGLGVLAVAAYLVVDADSTVKITSPQVTFPGGAVATPSVPPLFAETVACEADARAIDVAVTAELAEATGPRPTTSAGWRAELLASGGGGPFLASWPAPTAAFSISVAGAHAPPLADGRRPEDGDVLVRTHAGVADYTIDPSGACQL